MSNVNDDGSVREDGVAEVAAEEGNEVAPGENQGEGEVVEEQGTPATETTEDAAQG